MEICLYLVLPVWYWTSIVGHCSTLGTSQWELLLSGIKTDCTAFLPITFLVLSIRSSHFKQEILWIKIVAFWSRFCFQELPCNGDAQSFWESNSAVSISGPRSSDKDCVNLVRVMIYLENYPNRSGLSCDWLIADTERRLSICIQLIWLFSWFLNLVQALD